MIPIQRSGPHSNAVVRRERWRRGVAALLIVVSAVAAPMALAPVALAQTYTVLSLPEDIGKLACTAFQKSGGGWTIVGTIVTAGGSKLSGGGFASGSREAAAIEKSCGEKAGKPQGR